MSYPYQNFQGAGGPGYSPPFGGQYASPPPQPQQPWGAAPPPAAQNWAPQYQAAPPPAPSPGWQGGYPGQGYGPNPGPPFPAYAAAAPPAPNPASAALAAAPVFVEYPYILTSKHQMTLFTPDRSRPLFTVNYPDTMSFSWSKSRNMSILDAAGGEIARAEFHSFTTDKVDLWFRGREYHFKKKFGTQTGLLFSAAAAGGHGGKGGEFLWSVGNGEMMLTSAAQGKAEGPILARFVPREARDLGDATKIAEGRLELRMMGLSADQFGEVFLTLVAEMERRRKNNEEVEVVSNVI